MYGERSWWGVRKWDNLCLSKVLVLWRYGSQRSVLEDPLIPCPTVESVSLANKGPFNKTASKLASLAQWTYIIKKWLYP